MDSEENSSSRIWEEKDVANLLEELKHFDERKNNHVPFLERSHHDEQILIPTDGSANSLTALEYGIYIARKLGASLAGLYVIDVNLIQGPMLTDISGAAGMPPYEGFFDAIEKSLEEKADFILKEFQERCQKSGITSEIKKSSVKSVRQSLKKLKTPI